ncbi:MAG: GNAT family N-acetyltransferase [Oscillospiraceae bacterium]|nr:GNAT family N-acetyltransferase [Oscillospiraceae bacterium]
MLFETKDLIVDQLTMPDAEDFHRICNQPFILKWMDDWEMDLNQVRNLLSHFIKGYGVKNPEQIPYILAIRSKMQRLIGICGFGPKDELGGKVEIAYFIDEEYAGKGYMSQVIEKAVDFYFSLTSKPYLCALVDEKNIASKRLLIKNNFVYIQVDDPNGVLKSHYRCYYHEKENFL